MNTQVVKQQSIANFLNKSDDYLVKTLGSKKSEFVSNLLALSEADKGLQQCEPAELMKCAMNATALNLPLNKNIGCAYVIAYKDWKTGKTMPQFQMGYKGFVQLAIRSGQYKTINAVEVREGEIRRNKFTGFIEFFNENPNGKIVGFLAYIELLNGYQNSHYMTIEELKLHAEKYSKSGFNKNTKELQGVWRDNFEAMAKKTVLKLLLSRYGVLSVEMQNAILNDQANHNGEYIDNPQGRYVVDADVIVQAEPEPADELQPEENQETKKIDIESL